MIQRTKFCPKCGKQTENFYDNLCKDCFLEKMKLIDLPEKIVIIHCRNCGRFYGRDKGELSLEDAVNYNLSKILKQNELQFATYRIDGGKVYSEVTLESAGLRKTFELDFRLIQKETICRFCGQKFSGYYNSILQLRNSERIDKILKEIETEIDRLNKRDTLAFVSKIDKVKNGVDVYIGSKSAANKVVHFLKSKYEFKPKISRKQYGIENGKKVFRDTILILLSD